MTSPSDISIVIVNWNSGALLRDCVRSIAAAQLPDSWRITAVVIVDNASTDGSCDDLEVDGVRVVVVRNTLNRGFAAACNQGGTVIDSELILFLNPDTRLFQNSLHLPIEYMSSSAHGHVGITGIQLVDESGAVARCCARFPRAHHFLSQVFGVDRLLPSTSHLMRDWDHKNTRRVDQVIGAFFLVRRALFDELSGFDERFFVYFEEVDFARRAKKLGWSTVFVADAQAFHVGGGSSGQIKGRRLYYSLRSRLQYGVKHFSVPEVLLLGLVTLVLEPIARGCHLAATGRFAEIHFLAQGYWLLARHVFVRAGRENSTSRGIRQP